MTNETNAQTYNVMFDWAFAVEGCSDPDGDDVTAHKVRAAIINRLNRLTDSELIESIGFVDSYDEGELK